MRFLREAALYAGLGAVPALAMHYAPLGGLLLSPVLVASQAASFLRGGMMMGTAVALVLGGMLLALLGATQVFVSSVGLILLGGCMAFGVGKWGVGFASLCLACSMITLLMFAGLWVYALQVGYQSPFAFLTESMVRAGAGVNEASLPKQNLKAFATWFGLSFPALLCCTFSWEGFAALALLVHLGIAKMPQEGLLGIHFSDAWVWPLLGGGFGLFLIQYEPMKALALNCLLIGVGVFFFPRALSGAWGSRASWIAVCVEGGGWADACSRCSFDGNLRVYRPFGCMARHTRQGEGASFWYRRLK
jgi:hypothetical protein